MATNEKKATVETSDKDLLGIIKMLISKNEQVSVENFEKIIPSFDGNNMSVKYWFENYERNADAYGLSERQKYVHARNKITGEAQLFIESIAINNYTDLKTELVAEFKTTLDSETIHQQLQNRKIRGNETFREYVLQMKTIAAQGNIEESALIKYVVSGSALRKSAKYLMYSSKTIKQLYENYESVKRTEAEDQKKPAYHQDLINNNGTHKKKIHCYNCGSTTHKKNECTTDTKCFACNANGHIAKNCPKTVQSIINIVTENKRMKQIKLNDVDVECLVDTGADVTLIKRSVWLKLKDVKLQKCFSTLRGFGLDAKTSPIGEFIGEAIVDDIAVEQKFLVVPDLTMAHDEILGYDFISKFEYKSNREGYKFEKLITTEVGKEQSQISIYNITDIASNILCPPQHSQYVTKIVENYKPERREKCPVVE